MTQLQIAYLPRPGTQERWRRLFQEVAELHQEQFSETYQQAGITQVEVRLLQMLHGELFLVSMEVEEPEQARKILASSQSPFAHWLREHLRVLLGWDVQEVLSDPPTDLLFTWEWEQPGLSRRSA